MTLFSNPKALARTLCTLLLPIILVSFGQVHSLAADETSRQESIAILPLQSHTTKDLAYLQEGLRDMLASRLSANAGVSIIDKSKIATAAIDAAGDNMKLREAGTKLGADYLFSGSITSIGAGMSLDVKVLPVSSQDPAQTFYASAAREEDILQAVDKISWDIAEKVFNKKNPFAAPAAAAPVQADPAPAAALPPSYQTPHPERAFMMPTGEGGAKLIRPMGVGGGEFTKSQNFSMLLQALDVGDVDGDGIAEIVLADKTGITIYKHIENTFKLIGQTPAWNTKDIIHAVHIADLNDNGRAEIYVSAADTKRPNSFAMEWDGQQFAYIFQNLPWYVRTLRLPEGRTILAGQKADVGSPIKPGIFELSTGPNPDIVQRLAVPAKVNLFDFTMTDLDNNGSTEIVALDQSDRIKVMHSDGDSLWESDDYFGGTKRYIGEAELKTVDNLVTDNPKAKERTYIPSRIIVGDMNHDGQNDIVINKNQSTASRVMRNYKSYPSGEIYCLTWNGIALSELWHTMKIDGYVADYQLVPDKENPDLAMLYVGVQLGGGVLEAKRSTVLMYHLDFSNKGKE